MILILIKKIQVNNNNNFYNNNNKNNKYNHNNKNYNNNSSKYLLRRRQEIKVLATKMSNLKILKMINKSMRILVLEIKNKKTI